MIFFCYSTKLTVLNTPIILISKSTFFAQLKIVIFCYYLRTNDIKQRDELPTPSQTRKSIICCVH